MPATTGLVQLHSPTEIAVFVLSLALALSCAPAPGIPDPEPAVAPDPELVALWEKGRSLEAFVDEADQLQRLWQGNRERARIPEDVARRAHALEQSWRILVVAAAGCHDSANNIPPLARLALYSDNLELRVVTPGEGGQAVMDARKTPDGRAATPTVVILDGNGDEAGCWIERPARQHSFYLENLKGVERGSEPWRAAVQEFLGWYEEDNGAATLREVLEVLEAAENGARGCGAAG